MKRIGIFTYMQTNYGAILQAYALQHYLRSLGNDVEIIDFTTELHLIDHKVFKRYPTSKIKNFIINCLTLLWFFPLRRREKRNMAFKKKNYNFSARFSTKEDILSNPPQEDVYVTGSDQVFNLNSPYYEVYYLNFPKGKSKKIAYAPSFGISNFSNELKDKILPYLQDFDALSCRETSGAAYMSMITGRNIPTVVDPVLLLSADEWTEVATVGTKQKYILVYDLNGGYELISVAKRVKKELNLPIYCITGNYMNRYEADKTILDAGPSEFLGYFKNASFVVTDSFHGTSFALIFSVPFLTYIAVKETSGRISSLLEKTGLQERMIYSSQRGKYWSDNHTTKPNVNLAALISSSKDYLKRSL